MSFEKAILFTNSNVYVCDRPNSGFPFEAESPLNGDTLTLDSRTEIARRKAFGNLFIAITDNVTANEFIAEIQSKEVDITDLPKDIDDPLAV